LALLAALFATPAGARAAVGPSRAGDLDLVPPGAAGLVVLHPAEIAAKLGGEGRSNKLPWGAFWKKQFGIPFHCMEACVLVLPTGKEPNEMLWIIRTVRPYPETAF
jgi:hypothetical protein